MRDPLYADCVKECEAAPRCMVCGLTKTPVGRSAAPETAGGMCDLDCPGYRQAPHPGHLWPGELARIRQYEAEQAADKVAEGEVGS